MYAVIDTETTGLSLNKDRIIELAVIGLDRQGNKEWEWCSLVNPERDTGHGLAIQAHQIYPRDVENAPMFHDLAGEVIRMLDGRAVIAHNAQFDLGMLGSEFMRLGHRIPELVHICTASMARKAGFRPYRLVACCDSLGIELDGLHHALADARATTHLVQRLLDFSDESLHKTIESRLRDCEPWPRLPAGRALPVTRRIQPIRRPRSAFSGGGAAADEAARRVAQDGDRALVETFSIDRDTPESKYLAAVEWALEDREITSEQKAALDRLRTELRLSDEQVREIHITFVRGLAGSLWSDGVITSHEQFDLDLVGELLQLSAEEVEYARDHPIGLGLINEDYCLKIGDRVVFTGEMSISRSEWKERAKANGLKVVGSVSGKTNYLVVPFGETGSTRSRKARELGVRVVSEQRFRRMLSQI